MGKRVKQFEGLDLSRVGVVDVGSNSVRLVVFDGAARSPAYFFNEKVLCGLGAGVAATGKLNHEGRRSALSTLRRFVSLAERMNLSSLTGVATAAVREAEDGPDFVAEVARETGLELRVVEGIEEARLAAQGVLVGWPDAVGLTVDIGGASMELARVHGGRIGTCVTSKLAPLSLADISAKKRDAVIANTLADLRQKLPGQVEEMFLVGGSWRAIANLHMARTNYPLNVLHAYEVAPDELLETVEWAVNQDTATFRELVTTSEARLALVPLAAQVLRQVIRVFEPDRIAVSSYGLREGVLYEQMSPEARQLDPLTEACRHMEIAAARFPGFGEALYQWVQPLFALEDEWTLRLIHAACLLHDVNWRTHPDFRPTASFESVTRANLGGITHRGRIFLGLMLANRYKSGRRARPNEGLVALLSADQQRLAETVGRTLRLGSMLTGASVDALQQSRLILSEGEIVLILDGAMAALRGEVVEKRLAKLASNLGLNHRIQVD